MVREALGKHYIGMNKEFRFRGEEPGRLENFSDAVFALAITLLLDIDKCANKFRPDKKICLGADSFLCLYRTHPSDLARAFRFFLSIWPSKYQSDCSEYNVSDHCFVLRISIKVSLEVSFVESACPRLQSGKYS